jgi:hypothetical protein
MFYNNYEMIQHLFFDCTLAKFIWRIIQLIFRLGVPTTMRNVFGACVQNMNIRSKHILYIGIGVMFWRMWLRRNDNIFNKLLRLIIYIGYFQIHSLDMDMGTSLDRGKLNNTTGCLQIGRNHDNESLRQA